MQGRVEELRASGLGFDRIAAALNAEGVPTRTPGKRWRGFAVNSQKATLQRIIVGIKLENAWAPSPPLLPDPDSQDSLRIGPVAVLVNRETS
jgi:hypothetical protein